ncbi:hypothetical protein LEMLEM_LOCUS17476 [Lemmus lemmus]
MKLRISGVTSFTTRYIWPPQRSQCYSLKNP